MEEEGGAGLSFSGWLALGAVTLLAFWIRKTCRVYNTFTQMGIPGPKPWPMLGNLTDLMKMGIVEQIHQYTLKYGKVFGMYINTLPMLCISDLDILREIMVKKFHYFPNRQMRRERNYKPWNLILTQLRDDHWKHVRSTLSPTFSSGKIKRMMPVIQRVSGVMAQYLKTTAPKDEPIELKDLGGRFAMDVIAGVAFGIDVDSIHNPKDPFVKQAMRIMNPSRISLAVLLMFPRIYWVLKALGIDGGTHAAVDFFVNVSDAATNERQQGANTNNDFLQLLMEAEKEGHKGPVDSEINHGDQLHTSAQWTQKGLTKDEINANAFLFLLAGYETVSTVMAFTLFCLAHNPECLRKAQQEVDEKLGKQAVDHVIVQELTYVEMCINEAMRLYPPAFVVNREAREDVEVLGLKIQKDMLVMAACREIHMDPDSWPQPDKFDPMRHTTQAKAERHPFAFMPFGMGPRNCIGMRMAQLEVRMAVATIIQQFTPVTCEKSVNPPKLLKIRMQAVDGLWIKLQPRA